MIPREIEKKHIPKWAQNVIFEGYRGSHGHGTYIPNTDPRSVDDIDIFRIVIQPKEYYLGLGSYLRKQEHYEEIIGEYDILAYDIRKFVHLLGKGNPNVHLFLWLRTEDYFKVTGAGRYLISRRKDVLSRKVIDSFSGYATAQIKRMTNFKYEGYMGEKRKALVSRLGFDCKNAAHCIRLLLTVIDLLKTGELVVYRLKDRDMLIDIKTGKWGLEEVKKYANELMAEFSKLSQQSEFPPFIATEMLNDILLYTMNLAWRK